MDPVSLLIGIVVSGGLLKMFHTRFPTEEEALRSENIRRFAESQKMLSNMPPLPNQQRTIRKKPVITIEDLREIEKMVNKNQEDNGDNRRF